MATTTRPRAPESNDGVDHLAETRQRHPAGRLRPGRATGPCVAILGIVACLTLLGLVMVISASSVTDLKDHGTTWYSFKRQAVWAVVGTFGLVLALRVHYRRWRRWAGPMLIGAVALLVLVLVPGIGAEVNGSSRWIGVGALRVQPSEFAKLAVLLFVAKLLADREREGNARVTRLTLKPTLVVFGGVAALLMLQPNLGTTIVLGAIVLAVLFIFGARLHHLGGVAVVGVGAATALALQASYRRARVTAFLDPWADVSDSGYQTIQSLVGIASGGLFGVGLGASRAKYEFLPEAHTDFIFAIVAEELGLFGAAVVIGLFVALTYFGVRVALETADPFGRLVATGITTWFGVQAFVNIGAVVAVLPITGVPLPFVSFGGSSLVVTMIAAGILANIASHTD
ncbi:MAG: putative lipid II flippase FtsW [Microthrixaceae bacterium]|nr:putative lipid II flippase FtsW [Microthrixaceae bacterium]